MKKLLYQFINSLGYGIVNKKKLKQNKLEILKKHSVTENTELFVRSGSYIEELDQRFKDIKFVPHNRGFKVQLIGIDFYLESPEEFFILKEVFVENDYQFGTTEESTVIDIGTNVGIAALFFSQFEYVKNIYCFEPVPETFRQAKYNLSLNPNFHKVTQMHNVGLGSSTRKEVFLFDDEVKGNTGLRGTLSPSYAENPNVREVEVQISDASEMLLPIFESHNNQKIILKIDCEGGEYEIFRSLHASGLMKRVDVIMMEWHDKGTIELTSILLENGFNYFSKTLSPISGLIYAFRK